MTEREQAVLWLGSFMKNKEPMTLIPKPLIRLMYGVLTKEQEPVEVEYKKIDDGYQAIEDEFTCKHCGAWWMIPKEELKYCPGCGKKVKWDAVD